MRTPMLRPRATGRLAVSLFLTAAFALPVTLADADDATMNEPGRSSGDAPARRISTSAPKLFGPIDDIAVMGDSLYFERIDDSGRVNTIVPLVRESMRTGLSNPTLRVRNLSRPGLAIKFPLQTSQVSFIALDLWIRTVFAPGRDLPDLVVLPATSIDLNIKQSVSIDDLVPALVEELRQVVGYIESRGVQVVVVPAFAINDAMYDGLTGLLAGMDVRNGAAERVRALNRGLHESDLPMLFAGFRGLDLDYDGDADEENFFGFAPGSFPDDGIHTNAVGEKIIADHISRFLIESIQAA